MTNDPFTALNAMHLRDFRVVSFVDSHDADDDVLVIRGSNDFCYSHDAGIHFINVSFMERPMRFSHAQFRIATDFEIARAGMRSGGTSYEGTLYCIESESGSNNNRLHFIAAGRVEVNTDTVKYSQPQHRSTRLAASRA
jgi:hypothetical protein